ncbi:FACT complex subunit SSRP1 [Micractinium conductrix]|uniref:FACT complex subunit SSRP1 n=1 Tax=Micractinium conductrix TaxID=554055 RepID=A0A2P6VBB0_9CHLO|nr:FACT complex subunit SSRP1 [Micractinium conductrix]|eukprot:PSC71373.1 FACT complex subunit SSRP1 [Micractinium conductrix]
MASGEQSFGNIALGSRSGAAQGSLKASADGFVWKRSGGGRTVEAATDDIEKLTWTKASRGGVLNVKLAEGPALRFMGFRDKDVEALRSITNKPISDEPLATHGHNWGKLVVDGSSMVFRVGGRTAFAVPLPDVSQAQQGREEVMLEFPVDDSAAGDREDTLVEMSFYVPKENEDFAAQQAAKAAAAAAAGEGEVAEDVESAAVAPAPEAPAKYLFDLVSQYTDAGAATGDAVATFDQVGVLVPRGRFDIEMYLGSLKLVGQAQDYRIQYDSIVRVFLLPKTNVPQTLVVISLDPPIRKGQTFYNHILCQFPSDEEAEVELDIGDDALAAKNEKCGGRLQRKFSGPAHEVFAKVLRGLSGTKLTKPGTFRDAEGTGHAVRCSFKADDGFLYPLERAFFYVQKPPLLLVFDDVDSVEFMRQAAGATSAKTFDLAVRMRNGQDYLFRGIPRSEWTNLFEFIQAKQLRIENFREAQRGPGAAAITSYAEVEDGGVDAGLAGISAGRDSDEEDEDFQAESEEEEESSSEDEDEDGPKIVDEEDVKVTKKAKSAEGKPKKAAVEAAPKKQRKPKKEKDPNAPKRATSAFFYFSQDHRGRIKAANPGFGMGDIAKALGAEWKALTAEEKAPYDERAKADKERYQAQQAVYKASKGAAAADDEEAGGEEGGDDE